jgi:heat shock protein HtpX
MPERRTFRELIAANKRNSMLLMLLMFAFFLVLGGVLGGAFLAPPECLREGVVTGMVIGAVAAAIFGLLGWFGGTGALMAFHGARKIRKSDHPQLFNVVEEVAIAAGVPMPDVYIMNEAAPNAFATGTSPENASVAVTTGLLEKLDRNELQGVIAHEVGHIRNFDIRYSMLMAMLAGGIVILSEVLLRASFFRSNRRSSNNRNSGNLQLVLILVGIVLAILAPILTALIQLAMSRQREYLADASAVEFTRNPDGLAGALAKLAGDKTPMECSKATESMFIVSPKVGLRGGADDLFSTHPPIRERIKRLMALR